MGSRVGPDLTDVGRFRRRIELERALVDPGADVRPENRSLPRGHARRRDDRRPAPESRHVRGAADRRQGAAALVRQDRPAQLRVRARELDAVLSRPVQRRGTGRRGPLSRLPEGHPAARRHDAARDALLVVLLATVTLGAQVSYDRLLRRSASRRTGSPTPAPMPASATACSRRSRPPTSRTWSCSGCSRRVRSSASRPRRWWWTASCTRCRRPTTSWRSTRPPAACSGATPTARRPPRVPAADASTVGVAILDDTLFMGTIDGHLVAVDAKTGKPIWDVAIAQARIGLRADARAAGRQGQGDRRTGRRRVRHSRVPGRVRREDRQGSVAVQHDSRAGRGGTRDLGRRLVEARRRSGVADRIVRPGPEPDLLGDRQPRRPTTTAICGRATTSTRRRSWRSTPTPAS